MNFRAHALAGIASFFVLLACFKHFLISVSLEEAIVLCFLSLFGALLPDIDAKRSKIHNTVFYCVFIILLSLLILSTTLIELALAFFAFSFLLFVRKKLKHRKTLHSLKFGIACSFVAGMLTQILFKNFYGAFFFFLGFFSHLVLDKLL